MWSCKRTAEKNKVSQIRFSLKEGKRQNFASVIATTLGACSSKPHTTNLNSGKDIINSSNTSENIFRLLENTLENNEKNRKEKSNTGQKYVYQELLKDHVKIMH